MLLEVLSLMVLAGATSDPCSSLPSREAELTCNFLLSEQEGERVERLLEEVIEATPEPDQTFGISVKEELRESQRLWEEYSDTACAASGHRTGGPVGGVHDSFEGYNTYFRCLRESQAQRSLFLWREYGLTGPEPTPITDVEWPEGMSERGPFEGIPPTGDVAGTRQGGRVSVMNGCAMDARDACRSLPGSAGAL